MNDLFEGIQWITSMVGAVGDSIARPTNWDQVSEQTKVLEGSMPTFEKALENADRKQISSLLGKDVKESFEKLNDAIKGVIDQEGKRESLN